MEYGIFHLIPMVYYSQYLHRMASVLSLMLVSPLIEVHDVHAAN